MLQIIKSNLPIKITEQYEVNYITNKNKEDLFQMYSNEKISKYVSRKNHSTLRDTEECIDEMEQRIKAGNNLYVGIYDSFNEKLIGIIRFLEKEDSTTLTLGYALNENYWGKGIIPMTLKKLIQLIKVEGTYSRLRATVREENLKSIRCIEKLGFQLSDKFVKEGTLEGKENEGERLLYYKDLLH